MSSLVKINGADDPFAPKMKWQWPVLSLPFPVVIFVLFSWIFGLGYYAVKWHTNNVELISIEKELSIIQPTVIKLEQQKEKLWSYARVYDALVSVSGNKLNADQKFRLTKQLWLQARELGFDPLIFIAVLKVESKSNPRARGQFVSGEESGALGLMQIKFETAQALGKEIGVVINTEQDLLKAEVNLLLGSHYLLKQIAEQKDLQKGLWAYNVGAGELRRRMRNGEQLPLRYSRKIFSEYRKLLNKNI